MGGLLDSNCNPGAATPEMLHRIYAPRAAVSANPCLLRELNGGINTSASGSAFIGNLSPGERLAEREALLQPHMHPGALVNATPLPTAQHQTLFQPARRRADSPPRGHFHSVSREYLPLGAASRGGACSSRCVNTGGIQLTMDSLKFGGTKHRPR